MLREIDTNLWVAEQPLKYLGLSVGTRMTIIRLLNGDLVLISPIKIDDRTQQQLDKIGTVSHIIAPNLYHYLFAEECKTLYPNATFWAVPGLDIKQPKLTSDRIINNDRGSLENEIEYLPFDGFRTLSLKGFDPLNEWVFFHPATRTLILTDTAYHFDDSFPPLTQFTTKVIGGYKKLSPSLLEKIATRDRDAVKESVIKVLSWDFERVIMAHGSIVEQNGKQKFKESYEWFLDLSLR
jgi:hypothetical protein